MDFQKIERPCDAVIVAAFPAPMVAVQPEPKSKFGWSQPRSEAFGRGSQAPRSVVGANSFKIPRPIRPTDLELPRMSVCSFKIPRPAGVSL